MQKLLFKTACQLLLCLTFCVVPLLSFADPNELGNDFYLDKSKVVEQQIELLKSRLTEAHAEINLIKKQQDKQFANFNLEHINKQWLEQAKLDISVAESNLNSINIELTESQQTINLLQKDIQEIENQINIFNVIGFKIAHNGLPDLSHLHSQLNYQKNLLRLEKNRSSYLSKLNDTANRMLQLYQARATRIDSILKSQTIMQLKERQTRYEVDFQQQQATWLEHLNNLYAALDQLDTSQPAHYAAYVNLQNEIFYANENVNFMYLQMLIVRYEEQIKQLKLSISRSSSITLLNKVDEQTQVLNKQFTRVNHLLADRLDILKKRKLFYSTKKLDDANNLAELSDLENQYNKAIVRVNHLAQELGFFRISLDHALQNELSARQGLLGFSIKAWLDLGNEIMIVPTLAFQLGKHLVQSVAEYLAKAQISWWILFILYESIWVGVFYAIYYFLTVQLAKMQDHELGHVNLKWLGVKVLHRHLFWMGMVGNLFWFFVLTRVPSQYYHFIINVALVALFFKIILMIARLSLVETVHNQSGQDVRLYYHLKWAFWVGGGVTILTVFLHQLPMIYEVKDLFYRLFLFFLSMVAIFLLRSLSIVTGAILSHIDQHRTYLRHTVVLFCVILPLLILFNSIVGLFGFINFVLSVTWYESIFLLVLIGYLLLRGVLNETMDFCSNLLIRHVSNGWLWTEAFLKPLDKIFRIILFLSAWFVLFFLYRWDRQSVVVESLNKILHYQLVNVLNTSITLISIIEIFIICSFLYWTARWTREFVYRFLMTRTKDLGVRNSIAILSQYTMIVIGVLIGLRVIGIDLRALTVVAGAFAFGVGLGLRDLANNFACGFLLLLERPLRVGDTVNINGHEGDVINIGGRAVTIRTWDHMDVLVPNAEIFSKTFINWTAKDHIVRSVITIRVNWFDSPHDVQTWIYETLASLKNVLSEPSPEVFLIEMVDDLVEFQIRYYVNLRQIKSRVGVRSEVLLAIWEMFEKHGIKPPHPYHEVGIKSLPLLLGKQEG